MRFQDAYPKHEDAEFLKFDRVQNKLSSRPDIHAFILLNQISPSDTDIISSARHDEIFLGVDMDEFEATEEQCIDLIRCGVRYDASTDSMAMFV